MIRRLLLGYLGIALFVLLALELPLGFQHQGNERHDVESKVERDATTFASLAEDAIQSGSQSQLRAIASIAYDYAASNGSRVVIVDRQGAARIDTSARVQGAESFASRPEIKAALGGAVSHGTRWSATLHEHLLYVAVPIASGGIVHGAARITFPTSAVDARILHYWLILAAIGSIVLVAAAAAGVVTARFVTRPLRGLEEAAAAVGEGDLEARAPEREGPPEVRSLAAVFNETVTKLGQLLRSQAEFVADASHELRTPLTALRLRIESIECGVEGESRADLEAAQREVERLSQLVEGLLSLARADAGATPIGEVDVAAVVRERVAIWQPLAGDRGVALTAEVEGEPAARAAAERLAQVLDNLVTNALAAAPAGTPVDVSARAAGPWVELRVVDRGPGLAPEQRARAFDRFWRAGSGPGGSGLGLAIVKRLVEADEGEVELADGPDGAGLAAIVRLRRA